VCRLGGSTDRMTAEQPGNASHLTAEFEGSHLATNLDATLGHSKKCPKYWIATSKSFWLAPKVFIWYCFGQRPKKRGWKNLLGGYVLLRAPLAGQVQLRATAGNRGANGTNKREAEVE